MVEYSTTLFYEWKNGRILETTALRMLREKGFELQLPALRINAHETFLSKRLSAYHR